MKDPDILPQQRREHADPTEGFNAVPRTLLALVLALVVFGVAYISAEDINQPGRWGDGRTAAELSGAAGRAGGGTAADGAALYAALCVACHQASGAGLPGVFPPLAGSEWVQGDPATAAAIVLHGVTGPITVAGQRYNGAMPAFHAQLDDNQLAALLTHLRSQWGNQAAPVSAAQVAEARQRHQGRSAPFAGEQDLPAH